MSDENEILEGMGLDENPSKDSGLDSSGEVESQAGVDAMLEGAADDTPKAEDGPADQAAIDATMDGDGPAASGDGPADQAAIDAMMDGGGDGGDGAESEVPKSNEPALHVEIKKVIADTDYLLADVEGLILAKVFYGLHEAYYDSWVKDARDNHSLIMRLNRRLRRYRGEFPTSKAKGGPR